MTRDKTYLGAQTKRWGAALDSWWRTVDQRPRLITFLAAGLALALGAGLTFRRATTPWSVLPDYDYS